MSYGLSKRIEIACHRCGRLYEVSVPSDIVSWEYVSQYSYDCNFRPVCPGCGKRTYINLIKGKIDGDTTRVY